MPAMWCSNPVGMNMNYDPKRDPRRVGSDPTALAVRPSSNVLSNIRRPHRRDASPEEYQYIGEKFVGMYDAMFLIMDILGFGVKSPRSCTMDLRTQAEPNMLAICNRCGFETYVSDVNDFKFCPSCGQSVASEKTYVVKCEYNFCPWEYQKNCMECSHNLANKER